MKVIYYDRGFIPHKFYLSETLVKEVVMIQKQMITIMGVDPKRLEVLAWMSIKSEEDLFVRISPTKSEIGFYTYVGWYPLDGPDSVDLYPSVYFDTKFKKSYFKGSKEYIKMVELRHKKYLVFEKICGN